MVDLKNKEPELQDEVKHRNNDMSGIVIAKYLMNNKQHLDVRRADEKIQYGSPVENWEVVRECNE
jgi:hypothetical protein